MNKYNTPNSNILDVSCSFNGQGLLEVTFTCKGIIEFPTARNLACKSSAYECGPLFVDGDIYGDLRQIFRNGPRTQRLLPKYSYENGQQIWRCTSLCLQDGSPYLAKVGNKSLPLPPKEISTKDKYRISNSSYRVGDSLPLVYVSFSGIGDSIVYPTALAKNANPKDNPIKAFWGGEASTQLQSQYSRTDERMGWTWEATTILHLDHTPYFPNVDRDINDTDKLRIFDTSYKIDDETSLLYVTFTGVGTVNNKAIYPTALASGKALTDKPIDAFWGGTSSVNLPATWKRVDERVGWIWEATTVLNLDGSAISDEITELRSYIDIAEVPIAGKVDVTWDTGHELTPPITHNIRATVKLSLVPESKLTNDNIAIPYYATSWASFGASGSLENGQLVSEQAGSSGYLVGTVEGADAGTEGHTYKGLETSSVFEVWGNSSPSYDEYISKIYTSLLDSSISILFTSVEGERYYLLKTVTGLGKND